MSHPQHYPPAHNQPMMNNLQTPEELWWYPWSWDKWRSWCLDITNQLVQSWNVRLV